MSTKLNEGLKAIEALGLNAEMEQKIKDIMTDTVDGVVSEKICNIVFDIDTIKDEAENNSLIDDSHREEFSEHITDDVMHQQSEDYVSEVWHFITESIYKNERIRQRIVSDFLENLYEDWKESKGQ